MAQDLTNAKPALGGVYPPQVKDSPQLRLEPLLTPEQLRNRHLFGIPLISATKDPLTNRPAIMTDELLKDIIQGAVNQAEQDTHLDIMPVARTESHPWDRNLYISNGNFLLEHGPPAVLQQLYVRPPDNSNIFIVPLTWVDTSRLMYRQINIIPLLVALTSGGAVQSTTAGASVFLAIFSDRQFMSDFWQIEYISGFLDGNVPRIINELIGTISAIEVLSQLAASFYANSVSLGIDGLSQSISTMGPQRFKVRIEELEAKRKRIIGQIRSLYGMKFTFGQI